MVQQGKYLTMEDGTSLYCEVKEVGAPYWIIATHGIGEHLGRHKYMTECFGSEFNIFLYDLRGHGKSDDVKSDDDYFEKYNSDLTEILKHLKDEFKVEKYLLFGHSMGALIVADYMQNLVEKDFYPEKIYLSSPPIGIGGVIGNVVKMIPSEIFSGLSQMRYGVELPGMVDLQALSNNSQVGDDYLQDKLTHKKLHSKLLFSLVSRSKKVFSRPLRISCPCYSSVGSNDRIVSVKELVNYFTFIDKSFHFKVFPEGKHELHNEIERIRSPYLSFFREKMSEGIYS